MIPKVSGNPYVAGPGVALFAAISAYLRSPVADIVFLVPDINEWLSLVYGKIAVGLTAEAWQWDSRFRSEFRVRSSRSSEFTLLWLLPRYLSGYKKKKKKKKEAKILLMDGTRNVYPEAARTYWSRKRDYIIFGLSNITLALKHLRGSCFSKLNMDAILKLWDHTGWSHLYFGKLNKILKRPFLRTVTKQTLPKSRLGRFAQPRTRKTTLFTSILNAQF